MYIYYNVNVIEHFRYNVGMYVFNAIHTKSYTYACTYINISMSSGYFGILEKV